MEVELQNIKNATSTDYWSLASNQYPFGKFPKVSVGITISRAGSVSRGRDSAATPAFERNLSQATDGRSRPPKADNALLRASQEAANNDGSAKGEPEAGHAMKVSVSQPDDNANEQTGTFSFGTRREQGSNPNKSETPEFVSSQGKGHLESANKSKPNREVLRMKLWEILGGASQNMQAFASQNPYATETPDHPNSQTAKGPSSDNKKVFTSPVPDTIKTPDPLNHHFAKCKPSSDPIESDSDSPKVVETRPDSRSLGRKKVPAASTQSWSAKKPLCTLRSAPKQKKVDNVFTFNEKCTPKTVVKHAIGDSCSLKTLRRSNRKAKAEVQKIYYSDIISDKTTQDEREGKLSSRNGPTEKGEKAASISSFSRTRKTAESCSRSPKRGRRLNLMANVAPQKMQFPENLFAERQNNGPTKLSSQRTSLTNKKNDSLSLPQPRENLNMPENSDRSPNAHAAADNNFNSLPSGAANPSPEPKMHPWNHDSSPKINVKFGEQVTGPLAGRFRDTPDDFVSPTLAANVNISHEVSKGIDCNLYASKYSKSVDRSTSSFLASDPESEPVDEVDKTNELPVSESPDFAKENRKQPSLSAHSPTEDEGAQSSNPSFAKGYKFQKWLSDMDGPDKSPLEHPGRKTNPKQDRMSKRHLSSPTPFATSGTQGTTISDKGHEQCTENYLTRAFDQLVVVLGRFQTKIKSETSKKSSEILAATGKIIHEHLEEVEVQMQADVDKLVNAGKSKRKRLESSLEEQQEKLRILHEKFKEEVNKQLQDCSNSLEDFESYHAELKGAAEKQKSFHKKLLVNAEKTVGAQLNDAESKIADVQQRARKKMNGLKYVLKELIAETAD